MNVFGVEEVENALKPLVGTLLNASWACVTAIEASRLQTPAVNLYNDRVVVVIWFAFEWLWSVFRSLWAVIRGFYDSFGFFCQGNYDERV